MSSTSSVTETYSVADVENVMRWVGVDFRMIAESTGAITLSKAGDYQADIELLAKEGCLEFIDLTLFDGSTEVRAVRYTISTEAGGLRGSRPGGVLWPRVSYPWLRVTLGQTAKWNELVSSGKLNGRLRVSWVTSYDDISHATLTESGGRNYVSNAYGAVRKDYSK